jgi:hypothetical protein
VEKIMRKRLTGFVAVAAVFLSASPASANYRGAVYVTALYSDAPHTEVVGSIYPTCSPNNAVNQLYGTYSIHEGEPEFVGYCTPHGLDHV